MFVAANPQAYVDSYWAVNYLHVYTSKPGTPPPPTSVLSSVMPAASTTSVTVSGAEGTSTTPTETLAPPLQTTSTTGSSFLTSIISTTSTTGTTGSSSLTSTTSTTSTTETTGSSITFTSPSSDPAVFVSTTEIIVFVTTVITVTPSNFRMPGPANLPIVTTVIPQRMSPFTASLMKSNDIFDEKRLLHDSDVEPKSTAGAGLETFTTPSFSPFCCFSYDPIITKTDFVTITIASTTVGKFTQQGQDNVISKQAINTVEVMV